MSGHFKEIRIEGARAGRHEYRFERHFERYVADKELCAGRTSCCGKDPARQNSKHQAGLPRCLQTYCILAIVSLILRSSHDFAEIVFGENTI